MNARPTDAPQKARAMTAWDAQRTIMIGRIRRHFVLPNYTPADWWECDVFEVSAAGYFREYEVKLTRADFKVDRQKERRRWDVEAGAVRTLEPQRKHELLAAADRRGPRQFWFVTPVGLITRLELPPWAGLIELQPVGGPSSRRWATTEVVAAPRLHRQKLEGRTLEHARGVCYYRLHNLMIYRRLGDRLDVAESKAVEVAE
jgi:hypothetical protein